MDTPLSSGFVPGVKRHAESGFLYNSEVLLLVFDTWTCFSEVKTQEVDLTEQKNREVLNARPVWTCVILV